MKTKFDSSIQKLIKDLKKENKDIQVSLKSIKDDLAKYFKSKAGKVLLIERVGKGYRINGEDFTPTEVNRTTASITLKKKFNLEEWRKENNL